MVSETNPVELPLHVRVKMTHAMIAVLARENDVDILHIKGHAAPDDFYREGRSSSDADVLVRPAQADAFVKLLNAHGWKTVTSFQTGSIFRHAAALWHQTWGYVDVHRSFPGFTLPDETAFAELWNGHNTKIIANQQCNVPARLDHALIILVHASRDPSRGRTDADYVIDALGQETSDVELRAVKFGAETPYAIAVAEHQGLAAVQGNPDFRLWSALANGDDRLELLRGRLEAADGTWSKTKVIFGSLVVNRDHLEMKLERSVRLPDYLAEVRSRVIETVRSLARRKPGQKP